MLTQNQYKEIREEVETCKKPLFFFHDDPDGLCSFLLLYRCIKEGHGIIVKTHPNVDSEFLKKVEEYSPDKIFILDIALVEQEFIDAVKVPIIWIDHHGPYTRDNVKYFNPRKIEKISSQPASYICYKAVDEDIWISMAGCIGDMYWPEFAEEFRAIYPDLLPNEINNARDAYFKAGIGNLSRILSFVLKGTSSEAMKFVKILTRVKSPYEILKQETSQGKLVFQKYLKVNNEYQELLNQASKKSNDRSILLYIYPQNRMSFTGDLANELAYMFPDKVIIIGREKSGEVKLSLRSERYNLPDVIENALYGLQGYGGGHEHAAGAVVKTEDFDSFVNRLKASLG
ncbi:MAG: DHH family phosphoesterase [Candidatus Woesearchaeota archaeon]